MHETLFVGKMKLFPQRSIYLSTKSTESVESAANAAKECTFTSSQRCFFRIRSAPKIQQLPTQVKEQTFARESHLALSLPVFVCEDWPAVKLGAGAGAGAGAGLNDRNDQPPMSVDGAGAGAGTGAGAGAA